MKVENKRVFVTGASRGMGLAFSKELNKRGALVVLGMRSPEKFKIEGFDKPENVELLHIDLANQETINTFIQKNQELEVDILINNAGQLTGGLIEEQDTEDIYSMFQVNLVGLIHLTKFFVSKMVKKGSGKIVNNSSVSAIMHFPCASTYAASKAGLYAFTNCLDSELEGTGVSTLTLITPGIKTDMFDELEEMYGKYIDTSDFSKMTPQEYAVKVVDCIEDDSRRFLPSGKERVGLFVARHIPSLFKKASLKGFSRQGN